MTEDGLTEHKPAPDDALSPDDVAEVHDLESADGVVPGEPASEALGERAPDAPTEPAAYDATGEPAVDAALDRLRDVESAPLTEHVAVYDDVHRRLQDALTDVDEG